MAELSGKWSKFIENIRNSGLTIYDPIPVGDPDLWIPAPDLEGILNSTLVGLQLAGLPIRTRSKNVKSAVCGALGYPIPKSFRKTQPRFPGQCFDTYAQKANNLQVWNEELESLRRYVLLRIDEHDKVSMVRVVTGETLARLDTTRTLTQKYQARALFGGIPYELITQRDTTNLQRTGLTARAPQSFGPGPTAHPDWELLLPIDEIGRRLKGLIGKEFPDLGAAQERNRGAELHRLVCEALGYSQYSDNGRFPDVPHQLLEVKLQTSPTVDLGLVSPDSSAPIDVPQIRGTAIRHCDVRYAVFGGHTNGERVTLTHLILTTGESFFSRFVAFGGKVLNKKLQFPLPRDFFA